MLLSDLPLMLERVLLSNDHRAKPRHGVYHHIGLTYHKYLTACLSYSLATLV